MPMNDLEWDALVKQARAKYHCLVKWCQQIGSYDYYINNQCVDAWRENAPEDVVFKKPDGTWQRLADCSLECRKHFENPS